METVLKMPIVASTRLSQILPSGSACSEQIGMPTGEAAPEEMATLRIAVSAGRRQQFAAGRTCAHAAMRTLGAGSAPVLRGKSGEPLWPRGVVGSITHCDGYCAAAVADKQSCAALGIDAEVNQPLPEDVLEIVARNHEADWVNHAPSIGIFWDRLLFSAKESVYKAWYPRWGVLLDFCDVEIMFDLEKRVFVGTVRTAPLAPSCDKGVFFRGRYMVEHGVILTSAVLPAEPN